MMVGRGSAKVAPARRRTFGVHLVQVVAAVESPRPSVVVELDPTGALTTITRVAGVEQIVAALPQEPALVAVDAPLAVPNETGRRDLDELLAWLDVPVLPVSRRRLNQLHGGLRGEELRAATSGRSELDLVETVPDVTLRLLQWRELGGSADDLQAFRGEWLTARPRPYRPKGTGRARTEGLAPATALLAREVELGGWTPRADDDDWAQIEDAAILDAVLAAYAAWQHEIGRGTRIATTGGVDCVVPGELLLDDRIAVNVARMRATGAAGLAVVSRGAARAAG